LLKIEAPQTLALGATLSHPLLDAIEQPYATDPAALHNQLTSDYNLIFGAINVWSASGRSATAPRRRESSVRFRAGHAPPRRPRRVDRAHDRTVHADKELVGCAQPRNVIR